MILHSENSRGAPTSLIDELASEQRAAASSGGAGGHRSEFRDTGRAKGLGESDGSLRILVRHADPKAIQHIVWECSK